MLERELDGPALLQICERIWIGGVIIFNAWLRAAEGGEGAVDIVDSIRDKSVARVHMDGGILLQ